MVASDNSRKRKRSPAERDVIFDGIGDAVVVIDVNNHRVIDANRAFLELYGLSRSALGKATCYQITHRRNEPCRPPLEPCPLLETVLPCGPSDGPDGEGSQAQHFWL